VIKKEAEKTLKYKDLTIEIQRTWNVKTKVIPVIIGATGTVWKSFRKYVSNIPGVHEDKELHKTAILGTAHTLRKILMQKYNRFNTGTNDISTMNSNKRTNDISTMNSTKRTNDISTMNSNNRIAATLYSLGT
jgi:hypothetical protein